MSLNIDPTLGRAVALLASALVHSEASDAPLPVGMAQTIGDFITAHARHCEPKLSSSVFDVINAIEAEHAAKHRDDDMDGYDDMDRYDDEEGYDS